MKRWSLFASAISLCALLAAGCSTLDERQREWIFQPSDRSWGNTAAMTAGMQDVWIDFPSSVTGQPARLHGLWLGDAPMTPDRPVMLYLHGARYNVAGSAPRIQRMHELGFGLRLDTYGFEDDELREAVDRLAADEALRARMAAAGESIRAKDGKRVAADLIERVGREGRSA